AVVQEDLAVRRLEAGRQGSLAAAAGLQLGQRELDVLAGTERVGLEVGAGAEVVARPAAADGDAVGVAAVRVGDLELGEDRVVTYVLQGEVLLAAELPPQLNLPGLQRHLLGLV